MFAHTSLKTWYNKRGQLEIVPSINSQIEQEDCHHPGWIEILHFPFGSLALTKTEILYELTQILHDSWRGIFFHQGLGWNSFIAQRNVVTPRCFVTPKTGKTAVFTGDRSTNQRRMEMYSYSLMQTKHISSKLIVLYNLQIKEHGKLVDRFLLGTL